MKHLLFLAATLVWSSTFSAADAPSKPDKEAASADGEYQDVVYFAESRPILIRLRITVDGRPLSALWDDYVTKVFRYLDANGDSFLDKAEVQRIPAPDVLFGGNYGGMAPSLSQLDTNGDGRVSRDELAAWFRRVGATPFQLPLANSRVRDDLYEFRLKLLLEEEQLLAATGRVGRGNADPDAVNDALFKLLDTNGDGKLSREELAAAPAVLLKRDRNDDEMVTPDEILPGAGPGGDTGTATLALYRKYDARGNRGADGPFWMAYPGASKADLARRIQRQYARGESAPAKLTREQLRLDEATFAKLDVDGDGKLDSEELARFAQRTPDLELKVNLGAKAEVVLVRRGAPLEKSVRTGKDGVLMLEIHGTRLDLKGLAAEKGPAAQTAKQERDRYLAEFKKADRDKNGYLDMAEAMRSPLYRNLFKVMDRHGDGMLFEKEVLAYLDAYQDLQAAARASCASVDVTAEGKGLFEMLDTNRDGRLSVREMRNAVRLIAELDRDGDGMLSRTEIPRCTAATFRMGPASGGGYAYTPGYADYVYTKGRRQPPQPAPAPRGPEWFRKMDRNGDGDVSRKEFLGTDAQFKEIDTDGDGLISLEEAEAYERKMREKREQK
jgi:Ca2+-binding EF-hand superfamily protein